MGPTWGPPGSCRPQMGPMLAPWTSLSGWLLVPPAAMILSVQEEGVLVFHEENDRLKLHVPSQCWVMTGNVYSVPSLYLNKCWNVFNWTVRNKLQWHGNQTMKTFIQNSFEISPVKCSSPPGSNSWSWYINHKGVLNTGILSTGLFA